MANRTGVQSHRNVDNRKIRGGETNPRGPSRVLRSLRNGDLDTSH